MRGRPPQGFCTAGAGGKVEVYPKGGGRFALLTGDVRPGLGNATGAIGRREAELAALFPPQPGQAAKPATTATPGPAAVPVSPAATLSDADRQTIVDAIRPHRVDGQRHDLDLALAGMLARNGVAEEQAHDIVAELSGGEEKAANAVRDTYRRHRAGEDIAGYSQLKDLVSGNALKVVDGSLPSSGASDSLGWGGRRSSSDPLRRQRPRRRVRRRRSRRLATRFSPRRPTSCTTAGSGNT